jgi:hypothetical protein
VEGMPDEFDLWVNRGDSETTIYDTIMVIERVAK